MEVRTLKDQEPMDSPKLSFLNEHNCQEGLEEKSTLAKSIKRSTLKKVPTFVTAYKRRVQNKNKTVSRFSEGTRK